MIPGRFAYHRPASVADAVVLLAQLGDEARPLAGGHSLIPVMKTRLAAPSHLVDLGGVRELAFIRRDNTRIVIGAMTTQHDLIASGLLREVLPVIGETALVIADPQVRYRGTIGGNVASGDPGNDMPALMRCLEAEYVLSGPSGKRIAAAREFYLGAYLTALAPAEILTEIHIPVPPAGAGMAYEKLKRKIGDYATAAAAVLLTKRDGVVATCSIGLTNVAPMPLWAEEAANALVGTSLDRASVDRAVAIAEAMTDPATDGRGTAEYRRKMAGVMLRRALARAAASAA